MLTTTISTGFQLNLIPEMEWLTTVEQFLYMQAHGSTFLAIILFILPYIDRFKGKKVIITYLKKETKGF